MSISSQVTKWLIGAVVCLPGRLYQGSNCLLVPAMDNHIIHCGIISSCQSAAASDTDKCRHANHSAFGGIIPHFRRFSAIPRAICEIIPLFHSIHLSHKNLVFSYINLFKNPITRGHLWSSNCTIIKIGWGFAPDPSGGAYGAPPHPRSWISIYRPFGPLLSAFGPPLW